MTSIYKPSKDEYVLFNKDIIVNPEEFNISLLEMTAEPNIILQRGKATYIEYGCMPLVLKHYYRGGLMARMSNDKYLWVGLSRTRVFKEWKLLEAMKVLKLPVPTPVAARVIRQALYYSADLITRRISNATALGELLKTEKIENSIWIALGQLIHLFHRHGIYHSDLNANNILVSDSQQLYLIDFDKSYFRMKELSWMQKMLARLKRSLCKIKNENSDYNFSDENWNFLIKGYSGS